MIWDIFILITRLFTAQKTSATTAPPWPPRLFSLFYLFYSRTSPPCRSCDPFPDMVVLSKFSRKKMGTVFAFMYPQLSTPSQTHNRDPKILQISRRTHCIEDPSKTSRKCGITCNQQCYPTPITEVWPRYPLLK